MASRGNHKQSNGVPPSKAWIEEADKLAQALHEARDDLDPSDDAAWWRVSATLDAYDGFKRGIQARSEPET